jgi:E3 ubiquitin-protein ligase HECTD1
MGSPPIGKLSNWRNGSPIIPIPSPPVELTYSSDGDTNGLFYYLGTNKGTTSWSNPFPQLAYSRQGSGSFDNFSTMTNRIIDAHPGNTWLETSSYIQVDLGATNSIVPNYVSIRSWVNNDRLPRNFKIQGSNDGSTFADLLTVTTNTTITGGSQWLSLAITGVSTAYRYLRYTAFSPGDSNNIVEVALGEWEFYGQYQSV